MLTELFSAGRHRCLMFHGLADDGDAVQAKQFLVVDGSHGALIDPGGNLAYNDLHLGLTRHCLPQRLEAMIAWAEGPACGIDLLSQADCAVPG